MTKTKLLFMVAGFAVMVAGTLLYVQGRTPGPAFIDPANQTLVMQGKPIYENLCASCHGVSLQGQPNWRERMSNGRLPAPPHDQSGHTWHHPDALLFDMVKNGLVPGKTAPPGYQSDMPAYRDMLTDEEIVAVLAYIKSSWPAKVLKVQKEITLQQQQ